LVIGTGQTYAELAQRTEPILEQWHDTLVPAQVQLLSHTGYSPDYAWMYAYEKRLKYRIEEVLRRPLGEVERCLFGPDGVFSETLSNAFVHGHRRDVSKAIEVRCTVGQAGVAFSIKDYGPGFKVEEVVEAATRGGTYFRYAGNGLKSLCRCDNVVACYDGTGTQLALLVRF